MKGSTLLFSLCVAAGAQFAVADETPNAPPPPSHAVQSACKADIQKLCSGVQHGGGRIRACMKQHEGELSDGCKQAIADAKPDHA
jgi:Cysteine rich repeat